MATIITESQVPQLLKRQYGDVGNAVPLRFPLFTRLQKGTPKNAFKGRDFIWPVITAPGGATSAYANGGKFPDPVAPGIQDASLSPVNLAVTVAFDEFMLLAGKTDAVGFLGNTQKIVKLAVDGFRRKLNIATYGVHKTALVGGAAPATLSPNGLINRLSAVAGGPPVTGITVDRPLGYLNADLGAARFARYLLAGDRVAYGSMAGAVFTAKGILRIDSVNYAANTAGVTVLSSPGGQPAATDWLSWTDPANLNNNSAQLMQQGLGTLLYQADDANGAQLIEGITCTPNNPMAWSSPVITSGGPFSQSDWHQAVRTLEVVGNGDTTLMVADPTMQDVYASSLFPDQRLKPLEAKGGYDDVPVFASGGSQIEFIYDLHCPYGMVYFLTQGQLFWLPVVDMPGWLETAGGQWKQLQMEDGVYAVFRWKYNLGFETLNSHAVVKGITIPNAPL